MAQQGTGSGTQNSSSNWWFLITIQFSNVRGGQNVATYSGTFEPMEGETNHEAYGRVLGHARRQAGVPSRLFASVLVYRLERIETLT